MKLLLVYLLLINAASLVLMHTDKKNARKNLWRIPERVLLGCAAAGGSLGVLIGMYLFRHKTKHMKFTLIVPVLFLLHAFFLLWYFYG